MVKFTDAILMTMLENIIETGNAFDPAALFLGVATAIDDLGAETTMSDITEPTGAMATRVALTPWGSPYKLDDGRWVADAPLAAFSPADATEGTTLVGYFLNTAGAAGTLKGFDFFDAPINLIDEFSQVSIIFRLTIDPEGRWSQSIVFNG